MSNNINDLIEFIPFEFDQKEITESTERFFIKDQSKIDKILSLPQLDVAGFINAVKPGDFVIVYPKYDTLSLFRKISYNMNTTLQGSAYSSMKMIIDKNTIIGFGTKQNSSELNKVPLREYIDRAGSMIILRHPQMTLDKAKKIIAFVERKLEMGVAYDELGILGSIIEHMLSINVSKPLNKEELDKYSSPLFCSTIFQLGLRYIGLDSGIKEVSDLHVWPKDFLWSDTFVKVAVHFAPNEIVKELISKENIIHISNHLDPSDRQILHIYIKKPNTLLKDGILSPSLAPESALQHYSGRANSTKKEKILEYLDSSFPGRSKSICVLTEEIPDNADARLLKFRNETDHVILPPIGILKKFNLIDDVYESMGGRRWQKVNDVKYDPPIDWTSTTEKLLFKNKRHYALVLKQGKIPVEYITIKQHSTDTSKQVNAQDDAKLKQTLLNLAKTKYKPDGQNQLPHIMRVVRHAEMLCTKLNIQLTPVIYAALLFHDVDKHNAGTQNHGEHAAKVARPLLSSFFSKEELDIICTAIAEHDYQTANTTDVGDMLRSADSNFLDVPWFLNKLYWKRKKDNTFTEEQIFAECLEVIQRGYLTLDFPPNRVKPKYWLMMYKDKLPEIRKQVKALTVESVKKILTDYIKKHGASAAYENLSTSIELKKKVILDYICQACDLIDPSKTNSNRYKKMINAMNNKQFDDFMRLMKDGKFKMHIVTPNMKIHLKNKDLLRAADFLKLKLFHKIWMHDDTTGKKYLTPEEYLVVQLPVRRQQQFLDEKMSVPDNDKTIDGLTGQVTGDSRACSLTNPEIQILAARNLNATLQELVTVRGGNIGQYGEMKRQLEETGEVRLSKLDPNSKTRVSVVANVLLKSMMIDNNI